MKNPTLTKLAAVSRDSVSTRMEGPHLEVSASAEFGL